jgi:uncharacterized membrane protein
MNTDRPIACTLDATEYSKRLAAMADLGSSALRALETDETHAVLSFDATPATRERLAAIVAAEASCCAFLRMTLSDAPDATTLRIEAPAGAEPILAELVAAFRGDAVPA